MHFSTILNLSELVGTNRAKEGMCGVAFALTRTFINSNRRVFYFFFILLLHKWIHGFTGQPDIRYWCRYISVDILSRVSPFIIDKERQKVKRPYSYNGNYNFLSNAHFDRRANCMSDDAIKSMKTFDSRWYKSKERLQMFLAPYNSLRLLLITLLRYNWK